MRLFVAGIVITLACAPPAAAATRYATPSPPAGADCSDASPCDLVTAIETAADGDTVQVGPGTYGSAIAPIDLTHLDAPDRAVTIQGALGPGRPVVHTGSKIAQMHNPGSVLRDLEYRHAGSLYLHAGRMDRVLAVSARGDACAVAIATIANSLCTSTDGNASGVSVYGAATLRNVTAVVPNQGAGFYADGLLAANSIFEGAGKDIRSSEDVTMVNSQADDITVHRGTLSQTNTVNAAAAFRGSGDYRQGAGAPSIDAGADDRSTGDHDLNGNLRKIGARVDIGAYEQVPGPPLVAPGEVAVALTTATLRPAIDQQGGAVSYRLDYGLTTDYGSSTSGFLPGALGSRAIGIALTGLARNTTYHYRIVATSDGGTTTSPDATFTTAPNPPSASAPAATNVTATAATLTAEVDTDGADGTAHFVVDGVARPGFSTSGGAVAETLSGLAPGSAHTARLVVTTAGGTAESASVSFTTAAAPPAPAPSPSPPVFDPSLALSVSKGRAGGQLLLSRRTVTLFVRCGGVRCTAAATGTVRAGRRTLGRLSAPRRALSLAPDTGGRLRLRSSAKLRRTVRTYLLRHRRAKVKIALRGTFVGADGTRIVRGITIKVRRLKR